MPNLCIRAGAPALVIAAQLGLASAHAAVPPGITILGARPAPAPVTEAPAKALHPRAPVPNVDVDVAGREPFQQSVFLSVSGSVEAAITIPTGKRLVIEEINVAGDASSTGGPIQPIALAYTSVAGGSQVDYYYEPTPSALVAGQFSGDYPVKIYSDNLTMALGFSGYSPSFLGLIVNVSGHLISTAAP